MPNLSQHVNFDRMMVADMMATTIATIEYIRMTELTSTSISFLFVAYQYTSYIASNENSIANPNHGVNEV